MFKTKKIILITGGSGALGSNIRKLVKCHAPDSKELDITDYKKCVNAVGKYNPVGQMFWPRKKKKPSVGL